MDVFLACSAIHLSGKQPRMQSIAMKHYSSAVTVLRKLIDGKDVDGTEDWLLIMAIFLCLFEVSETYLPFSLIQATRLTISRQRWNPDISSKAILHLTGAVKIFEIRLAKASRYPTAPISPFERVTAETILYQSSILSLYTDADRMFTPEFLIRLNHYFTSQPFPEASQWANSPLLGVKPTLYRLISQISRLSRRTPLNPDDHDLATKLADELHSCDVFSAAVVGGADVLETSCFGPSRLYLLAAKILLFKTMHPETNAVHPWIQIHVQEAMDIIHFTSGLVRYDQYFCWPFLIIGCALVRADDVESLREKLDELWRVSHCGDAKRAAAVLENTWKKGGRVYEAQFDGFDAGDRQGPTGFDVLIQKNGIFDTVGM